MRIKRPFGKAAGSIGIIGGADGPTAVYLSKKEQEADAFLQRAAENATANLRPFSDLIAYLKNEYHAASCLLSAGQLQMLKVNVILNHFPHLLTLPSPLCAHPSRRELRRYLKEDTSFEQAREYPAEELGLSFYAYRVPARSIRTKLSCDCQEDAMVLVELTSEYLCMENGCDAFHRDLVIWRGVSEEDIANKTPRFYGYAYAKKERGDWL